MAGNRNSVQTVGNSTYSFQHPLINGGVAVNVTGIKLESNYFKARQMVDNSKTVLLVNGGAITLTNNNKAGSFTINCVHGGNSVTDGDMVLIARQLQALGDSTGGTFRVVTQINGQNDPITFLFVTLKVFDALLLAGNDVPEYPIEFNYQDYIET